MVYNIFLYIRKCWRIPSWSQFVMRLWGWRAANVLKKLPCESLSTCFFNSAYCTLSAEHLGVGLHCHRRDTPHPLHQDLSPTEHFHILNSDLVNSSRICCKIFTCGQSELPSQIWKHDEMNKAQKFSTCLSSIGSEYEWDSIFSIPVLFCFVFLSPD